jgi:hypothetical protein
MTAAKERLLQCAALIHDPSLLEEVSKRGSGTSFIFTSWLWFEYFLTIYSTVAKLHQIPGVQLARIIMIRPVLLVLARLGVGMVGVVHGK